MPIVIIDIAKWAWAHKGIAGTILLTLLILGWASVHYLCGESRTEKRIDERTGGLIGANIAVDDARVNANVSDKEAVNAAVVANQVQANANTLRNANIKNVPLSKAMQDMCKAYPAAEGCQ